MPSPRKPNHPRTQRSPQSQRNAPSSRQTSGPRPSAAAGLDAAAGRSGAPELSGAPQLIDPRWILTSLALVFGVALLLSWGALCLLYYEGQWQLVLHPSANVATTPASLGLDFTVLHFADDATGTPQLDGWLIPASGTTATLPAPTALFLHSADGSIGARGSDSAPLPRALTLHKAGLNVLLFDYRGYGRSSGPHATEASMQQDTEDALTYLISTQHVPLKRIVVYGEGIGASLAVQLAAQHHQIPAIILDAPDGDLANRAARDPHSFLVPARLLFHETFPLAGPLRALTTPKLLISYTSSTPAALADAANPKVTIEVPSPNDPALIPAIQRFVDLYVTHAGSQRAP